jgi:multiple sugar transport system permease protein
LLAERQANTVVKKPLRYSTHERLLGPGITPALVVLAGVTILPFIFLVLVSFTSFDLARPETWTDFSRPLHGFQRLMRDDRFAHSLGVQAKLTVATVTLQLGIGLLGALLLRAHTRFVTLLRTSLLIPMVLPPIVGAIIWKVLYTVSISPINWILGLVGLPQPAWLAEGSLALVAIIIANVWQWFPFPLLSILIMLPFIRPTLFVVALFRVIDSIKAFPLIYVLTQGGPGIATEPTNFYAYLKGFSFGFIGYSSTMALVMLIITLVLSFAIFRTVRMEVEVE